MVGNFALGWIMGTDTSEAGPWSVKCSCDLVLKGDLGAWQRGIPCTAPLPKSDVDVIKGRCLRGHFKAELKSQSGIILKDSIDLD